MVPQSAYVLLDGRADAADEIGYFHLVVLHGVVPKYLALDFCPRVLRRVGFQVADVCEGAFAAEALILVGVPFERAQIGVLHDECRVDFQVSLPLELLLRSRWFLL